MTLCNATYWFESDLAAFGVALLVAGIIIPQIIQIAFRKKLFDKHDARKIHKGIVPRLGGIAFLPSIIFAIAIVAGINIRYGGDNMMFALQRCIVPLSFEICAVLLLYLVGIADDLIGVRYRAKFLIQIICGVLILLSGVWIGNLYGLLWIGPIPVWLAWPVTVFIVVYLVNSVNLIDGIDGLASGLTALALAFYAIIFFMQGEYIYSLIACASVGTLLPFIYYNVYGKVQKQKKIFMGDTGSLTIGMVIAFLAIVMVRTTPTHNVFRCVNPLLLAFSPMLIPCFDVLRVILHRMKKRRNIFLPDRSHIHHKLLAMGMSPGRALATILLAACGFVAFNVGLSPWLDPNILLGADILVYTMINVGLTTRITLREKKLGKKLYE